jgi:KaiC/GvpD/RAD55 family RecA-like ATPase
VSYLQIKLDRQSDEFKQGFMAAIEFLDGADSFQMYHSDDTSVTLLIDNVENATYAVKQARVVFDSTGVEL